MATIMKILVAGIVLLTSLSSTFGQTPIEQASKTVDDLNEELADIGVEYTDSVRTHNQQYLDRVDTLLLALTASLEESRKAAVQQDLLDKALKLQDLIEQYSQWIDSDTEPTISKAKRSRKDPAELTFERELTIAKRERERAIKGLDAKLLKDGTQFRDAALVSLEKLRVESMKIDSIDQAKSIRELAAKVKEMDLALPLPSTDEKPAETTKEAAENAVGECVIVIPPISNSTSRKQVTIPRDVRRVEISFFGPTTPESQKTNYPGSEGSLRINNKLVVIFVQSYKWRDAKTYTLSMLFDGSEINSRKESSTRQAIDVSKLVKAGETISVSYGNRQKAAKGVRFYFYK